MGQLRPKVSVVTTVFNGERYIKRGIPSILNQTYKSFEYLIVDDGSTDRTLELLAEIARSDSRVRIISEGRLGRTTALNRAVSQSTGKFIANQDIDDISYPDRLQIQVDYLEKHPSVGVLGGHYILVDEVRGERYVRMPPKNDSELRKALVRYIPFAHTIVMFRKNAWTDAGGYPDVDDFGIEDLRLWVKIASRGWQLANVEAVLGEHLVHHESYWHKNFGNMERRRKARAVHWRAVDDLQLPWWMYIYPLGRGIYGYLPSSLKMVLRRTIGGTQEKDIKIKE